MEVWNFFRLLICIMRYFHCLQATESSGYVGCFKDDILRKSNWCSKTFYNYGAWCILCCKASEHIYAATQFENCICGMKFRGDPKPGNCEYKCPVYQNETCGGPTSMSVYDIRLFDTKSSPPTQTDALVTATESINSFDEQTTYNEAAVQRVQAIIAKQTKTAAAQTTIAAAQTTIAAVQTTIAAVQTTVAAETTTAAVQTIITAETTIPDVQTTIAAVQTTIRSTTPNSSMKTTSEITSTEQVDLDTGKRTDGLVFVYISVPVLITSVATITGVIIFCLKRKRRKWRNSNRNRPRATLANSDDYINASLPNNLQYRAVATDGAYSNVSIPDTHSDHRLANVDNHYFNESLQSNLSHPAAANTDRNYANDSLQGIPIVSTVEHEYVDINYEELLRQSETNHCYSQL